MASNKDIDTFQAQYLAMMIQVREGLLTIEQAIAIHTAAMDKDVASRVISELKDLKKS